MIPRQRTPHKHRTYDFPGRLKRFKEESCLSWSEVARRLGTYCRTIWRWSAGKARPNYRHRKALLELADSMDLGHQFTDCGVITTT